jgi:hypothetical protein
MENPRIRSGTRLREVGRGEIRPFAETYDPYERVSPDERISAAP